MHSFDFATFPFFYVSLFIIQIKHDFQIYYSLITHLSWQYRHMATLQIAASKRTQIIYLSTVVKQNFDSDKYCKHNSVGHNCPL